MLVPTPGWIGLWTRTGCKHLQLSARSGTRFLADRVEITAKQCEHWLPGRLRAECSNFFQEDRLGEDLRKETQRHGFTDEHRIDHIRTTILPTLRRDSMNWCASTMSPKAKVEPTTGRMPCAATNAISLSQYRASRGGSSSR